MLKRIVNREPSPLDKPIARILADMETYDPADPEYKKLVRYLERLTELKTAERREKVKMDTIVLVGGNIVVVLIIVAYEHNHALLSKALTFIKSRP